MEIQMEKNNGNSSKNSSPSETSIPTNETKPLKIEYWSRFDD